ncbi:MAG: ATPase [Bacteroidetes bacterium]|nr:ATPase [Bacteroidota bacterium]
MRTDATFLGFVRRVIGATVLVEISDDIPSANPIIDGRVYRLGQVGSFVRIPLGFLNLFGIVSMVGSAEAARVHAALKGEDAEFLPKGQRWIEIQLVGEAYSGEKFNRGVSLFPTLDDEVHIVTENDLAVIYGGQSVSQVSIGTHSASESLTAYVDLDKLITRHVAIVGSTGSGKSNAVANLLKSLTKGAYPSARVVIIDPHGEYASAFQGNSRVYRIGDKDFPLYIPFWALSFDELAWFLVERKTASESMQDAAIREKIFELKKSQCSSLKAGAIQDTEITVDSPIPFDVKKLWYDLDRKERVTYTDMGRTQEALVQEGNAAQLTSARFSPPGAGSSAPFKPTMSLGLGSHLNKILGRLRDRRFDFLLAPGGYDGTTDDLHDLLSGWTDHDQAITILDLAGVPPEVTDLVVGVVARILYEGMFWGREIPGAGRQRPLLLILEEAHTYLPKSGGQFIQGYARAGIQRIFKEGRKYGLGAAVVSQRPSELDETILSQCGTFVTFRLSNANDQAHVKASVPDTLAGLIDVLPALRTGEALVVGESVQLPSRVRIELVEPRPTSNDPQVGAQWTQGRVQTVAYDQIVTGWRLQKIAVPQVQVTQAVPVQPAPVQATPLQATSVQEVR